jgi:tetratricopeptide (TPR) repeat protein
MAIDGGARYAEGMTQTTSKRGGSGAWVVVLLLLAGGIGAAIAYGWWSHQQSQWREAGVPPKDAAGSARDVSQAAQEIAAVGARFTEAVDNDQPLTVVRDAAIRLTEKYPGSADARKLLGQIYLAEEDKPAAYEQLALSLAIDGRQAEVEMLAGTISEESRDIDRALVHYHAAVTLAPRNARYLTFLGNAYLAKGDRDKARQTVLEALRYDSTHHKAYALLSNMFADEGKLSLALDQIEKAIDHVTLEERPVQAGYLRYKAMLLRRDNRPGEALQVLTEALMPNEQVQRAALDDIATTWGMLGEPARAAEAYEQALAMDTTRWALLADAARWRLRAGDVAAARLHVDALRRLQPNHPALPDLLDALARPPETPEVAPGAPPEVSPEAAPVAPQEGASPAPAAGDDDATQWR